MQIKDCEKCVYYQRRKLSYSYKPKGYHTIGKTHAFGYCTNHKVRVTNVKECEERLNDNEQR